MKLIIILTVATFLQATAASNAQKVTISVNNAPLSSIFTEIEKQTGYNFIYNYDWLQKTRNVTLQVKDAPLTQVLDMCFKDQSVTYGIVGKVISIKQKTTIPSEGQIVQVPVTIKGTVVSESGDPLSDITVTIKGSKRATATNFKGEFSILYPSQDVTLVFSGVNVETFELRATGKEELMIKLKNKTSKLDEVQVIAYGITTRRLNTGDVTTIKSEEIEKQPVSNPLAALEGRVPGLFITQTTGVSGGSFSVQLRGRNSIKNGNDPLYIIDGVPYPSQLLPTVGSGTTGPGNPLNFINISDIESIDILKDADATAIYGSRGSNGVILITTKKGKSGRAKLDLNFYSGNGGVARKMNLLNAKQYLQMRHEAVLNDGAAIGSTDYDLNGTWDTTRTTDWQKLLIGGTAHYNDVQASLKGGNENTLYTLGTNFHRETSVFPGNFADQRGSVNFDLNAIPIENKLKITFSTTYLLDNNVQPTIDVTGYTYSWLSPVGPPAHNIDGTLNWANSTWSNPFAIFNAKLKIQTSNLITSALLDYQIFPGLDVKTSLGYTNLQTNEVTTSPISLYPPSAGVTQGSSSFANNSVKTWILEPQASYSKPFGKGILTALLGTSFQKNTLVGQWLTGNGYSNDALLESLAGAASVTKNLTTNSQYKYTAIFSRVNYDFDNRFILNINVRRDGSSRFGPGNQFANFGSIAGAWIFSNEKFAQKIMPGLSFGKIKYNYGTTGNDQIGDYQYLSNYNFTGNTPYQNAIGLYPANLPNPNFQWEVNKKMEAGVELGFIKDRILVNADFYRNRSSNQLLSYGLPDITGFTGITANFPATVENRGYEFSISSINIKKENFSWTTSANLTIPYNKLLSFPGFATSSYANLLVIGQSISVKKVFHLAGVNDTTGIYQFYNYKGQPTYSPVDPTDKNTLILTTPKFYGALQNSFQLKHFQLDFLFQFTKQIGTNYISQYANPPGAGKFNQPSFVEDHWQKSGDNNLYQKLTTKTGPVYNAYKTAQLSDLAYSDASFIRLKNVYLSYRFGESWTKKMHLNSCKIYLMGQNLLVITKFKGADPENQNINALPPLRVVAAGLQVSF
ncbi:MAG TPA: SusC/RagA family TonB-linked outer membrane protein [Puia sp.]